jgi:hypothetical protein
MIPVFEGQNGAYSSDLGAIGMKFRDHMMESVFSPQTLHGPMFGFLNAESWEDPSTIAYSVRFSSLLGFTENGKCMHIILMSVINGGRDSKYKHVLTP